MGKKNLNIKPAILIIFAGVILALIVFFFTIGHGVAKNETIRVGLLHSLTGTMAFSERSLVDAYLLAIEEINQAGGVLGTQIEPVIRDGESNSTIFYQQAEKLITEDKVKTVFGCWTSACRKTIAPLFEQYNHLLFYPVQYEGLEESENIIYLGASPNQQIIPSIKWAHENLGTRFFLIGSDYIFPHTANRIIKDLVNALGGEIVGELYVPLGETEFDPVVEKIIQSRTDVLINTINGDSNKFLFELLRNNSHRTDSIASLSFSIAEQELNQLNLENMGRDFAAWNYFQSLPSEQNKIFIEKFKKRYGANRVVDDPIEAAYIAVHLWKRAVEEAGEFEPASVRVAAGQIGMVAPEGFIYLDPNNNHLWKMLHIGKIMPDGQFQTVWSSEYPIRPVPFPIYRSHAEWEKFSNDLFIKWGNHWENAQGTTTG